MGLIRFLLASAVVARHAGPLPPFSFMDAGYAIKVFFVISGFYMSLVLSEKYLARPGAYKLFITNRILRLYPPYITALLLSLFTYAFFAGKPSGPWTDNNHFNPWSLVAANGHFFADHPEQMALTVVLNVLMIGLELPYFVHLPGFIPIVPQAWTLSLEFYFYLLAPYLARLTGPWLAGLLCASAAAKCAAGAAGFTGDPWHARFFGFEIKYFLLGMLSHRIYMHAARIHLPKHAYTLCIAAAATPILGWHTILRIFPVPADILFLIYMPILGLCLPIIFLQAKDIKLDRLLGELSYPIYLLHLLAMYVLLQMTGSGPSTDSLFGWKATGIACMLSAAVVNFIVIPIDRLRSKRLLSGNAGE